MKYIITTCLLFFFVFGYSQDSTEFESPFIITKLLFGSQLSVDNLQVKFVDVINDSRCPKNVNCVRAGEAKVLIEIYKDEKLIEKKVLEITPTTYLIKEHPILVTSAKTIIKGFNLLPYPEFGTTIKKEDYTFQVVVEN